MSALLAALAAFAAALLVLPAPADDVSRTTADEPQYLLSAISLWEDGDLDIADELADERWRPFHADAELPRQTQPRPDGTQLSPHEPLLPLMLAPAVGVAGWAGAKAALALVAGALAAALTWTAQHRLGVPARLAGLVAAAVTVVPPLTVYGAQVYPELPAALVVTLVVAIAWPGRRLSAAALACVAVGLVALPWLAVKYLPVAAALGAVVAWRLARDRRWAAMGVLAVAAAGAGGTWVLLHQGIYGGWTAYAAGDHFVGGELTVAGTSPQLDGRSVRLAGLLVDRWFGLAVWAPVWLLALPALAALVRRRPAGWALLAAPLAAGWATATWVALTMSGWWWPGRQVVVVLPLAALALAWWVATTSRPRPARWAVAVATAVSLTGWWWTLAWSVSGTGQLVIDPMDTTSPTTVAMAWLLPDTQARPPGWAIAYVAWLGVLGALATWGWRTAGPRTPTPEEASP